MSLFDAKGVFTPLDDTVVEQMPPDMRAAYDDVATAAETMAAADAEVKAANEGVSKAMADHRLAMEHAPKPRPQVELVREMIASNNLMRE